MTHGDANVTCRSFEGVTDVRSVSPNLLLKAYFLDSGFLEEGPWHYVRCWGRWMVLLNWGVRTMQTDLQFKYRLRDVIVVSGENWRRQVPVGFIDIVLVLCGRQCVGRNNGQAKSEPVLSDLEVRSGGGGSTKCA